MSPEAPATPPFPRRPLIAAGILVGASLVLATFGRLTGLGTTRLPGSPVVDSRELRFEDRPDGSVAVLEPDGRLVELLPPGSNGFLRGVLRGLARERKLASLDAGPPFRLIRWGDGRLSVDDPATGRRIDLGAFGERNAQVFVRLLTAGRQSA